MESGIFLEYDEIDLLFLCTSLPACHTTVRNYRLLQQTRCGASGGMEWNKHTPLHLLWDTSFKQASNVGFQKIQTALLGHSF